jgi:hypothetical protein
MIAGGAVSQRELRLQQMAARLKQRLEQYKQENQQLEEMLRVADAKAQGGPLLPSSGPLGLQQIGEGQRAEWCGGRGRNALVFLPAWM